MEKIFEDNGTVLIQTYCFESGLWYLAKALGDLLERQGHRVLYVPKGKYSKIGSHYLRDYPEPKNFDDFKDIEILKMIAEKSVNEQIGNYIVKHDIKYFICFETLMEKSNWLTLIQRRFHRKLKIIDVPMIEWVTPKFLTARSYRMFDEIWALNDLCFKKFDEAGYENIRKISWPVVDASLFNTEGREVHGSITFLHLGSTNPDYSSKNTELVIKTFDEFVKREKPYLECKLIVRGKIPKKCKNLVEKHGNIIKYNEVLPREKLAELYKKSDCVVAPSSKEGLSLALYEAQATGCKIITTDAEPMNYIDTPYLCDVTSLKSDRSLIPIANVNNISLYKNFCKVYEDIKERVKEELNNGK